MQLLISCISFAIILVPVPNLGLPSMIFSTNSENYVLFPTSSNGFEFNVTTHRDIDILLSENDPNEEDNNSTYGSNIEINLGYQEYIEGEKNYYAQILENGTEKMKVTIEENRGTFTYYIYWDEQTGSILVGKKPDILPQMIWTTSRINLGKLRYIGFRTSSKKTFRYTDHVRTIGNGRWEMKHLRRMNFAEAFSSFTLLTCSENTNFTSQVLPVITTNLPLLPAD